MNAQFVDLFAVVKPICNKILVLVWATCCKHQSIPVFLRQNSKEIGLVLPSAQCKQVVDAGEDDWIKECSDVVLEMAQAGPLGEALFSCKVKDIVAAKLYTVLTKTLTACWEKAVADRMVCGETQLSQWRDMMLEAAKQEVSGLHLLPAKRVISVDCRLNKITGIPAASVTTQIDLMIVARMKAAAIEHDLLPALEAEIILGFTTPLTDKPQIIGGQSFDNAQFSKTR